MQQSLKDISNVVTYDTIFVLKFANYLIFIDLNLFNLFINKYLTSKYVRGPNQASTCKKLCFELHHILS